MHGDAAETLLRDATIEATISGNNRNIEMKLRTIVTLVRRRPSMYKVEMETTSGQLPGRLCDQPRFHFMSVLNYFRCRVVCHT